jgi:Xaa-Pro dipeptidase
MALHFTAEEFAARRAAALAAMAARGLDGLMMFRQESMYYLTGYDTFGFVYFQCLYLGADGGFTLLTRAPDLRQARHTSIIDDIRVWVDREGADPCGELRAILDQRGARGRRLGVEFEACGLTARNGLALEAALDGFCRLEDASDLISDLRLVKSPAEMAYVRRAAQLSDAALAEAARLTIAGADEGAILDAMQGAVFRGGGDFPANPFVIGSGPGALLCRYHSGRRRLAADDQLTIEIAGVYRHYHAPIMRTIRVGPPPPRQRAMYATAVAALEAAKAALVPGRPVGAAFDAHARVLDAAGLRAHRLNACGYGVGASFAPIWVDRPMLYRGNPVAVRPGMVLFVQVVVADGDHGLAAAVGQTVAIGERGAVSLSKASLGLIVN